MQAQIPNPPPASGLPYVLLDRCLVGFQRVTLDRLYFVRSRPTSVTSFPSNLCYLCVLRTELSGLRFPGVHAPAARKNTPPVVATWSP